MVGAIIPAAGRGTRMAAVTGGGPKELLPLGGRTVLDFVLDEALAVADCVCVVVAPGKPEVASHVLGRAELAVQESPRGFAHAVRIGIAALPPCDRYLVLLPDTLFASPSGHASLPVEPVGQGKSAVPLPPPPLPPGEGGSGIPSPLEGEGQGWGGEGSWSPRPKRLKNGDPLYEVSHLGFAQEMRKEPTPAEETAWRLLRREALGVRFRRQQPIGPFIVDFVCFEGRLVVELDGVTHLREGQAERDLARQRQLEMMGFVVLRFTDDEFQSEHGLALQRIREALVDSPKRSSGEISAVPLPLPPPSGGGGNPVSLPHGGGGPGWGGAGSESARASGSEPVPTKRSSDGNSAVPLPPPSRRGGTGISWTLLAHLGESTLAIAGETVPDEQVSRYGILEVDDRQSIQRIKEKPKPEDTPSRLAISARYAFRKEFAEYLERACQEHDAQGPEAKELSLTPVIGQAISEGMKGVALPLQGTHRLDCGSLDGYAEAKEVFGE